MTLNSDVGQALHFQIYLILFFWLFQFSKKNPGPSSPKSVLVAWNKCDGGIFLQRGIFSPDSVRNIFGCILLAWLSDGRWGCPMIAEDLLHRWYITKYYISYATKIRKGFEPGQNLLGFGGPWNFWQEIYPRCQNKMEVNIIRMLSLAEQTAKS